MDTYSVSLPSPIDPFAIVERQFYFDNYTKRDKVATFWEQDVAFLILHSTGTVILSAAGNITPELREVVDALEDALRFPIPESVTLRTQFLGALLVDGAIAAHTIRGPRALTAAERASLDAWGSTGINYSSDALPLRVAFSGTGKPLFIFPRGGVLRTTEGRPIREGRRIYEADECFDVLWSSPFK